MKTFALASFAVLASASYKKYPGYEATPKYQQHRRDPAGPQYNNNYYYEDLEAQSVAFRDGDDKPHHHTTDPKEWARPYYAEFDETEKEDWDTDMWGQQMLWMELNELTDEAELARSLNQDNVRSELDKSWELYQKKDYRGPTYGYDDYDEDVDVRMVLKQLNDRWDAMIQETRDRQRADLEAERVAHRAQVKAIITAAEAQIADLKQAIIDARDAKRADVEAANAQLRALVLSIVEHGIAEVNDLNDAHNACVLELIKSVESGFESDVKHILEGKGYGDVDLYTEALTQTVEREVTQPVYVAAPMAYPSYPSYPQYNQYQTHRKY